MNCNAQGLMYRGMHQALEITNKTPSYQASTVNRKLTVMEMLVVSCLWLMVMLVVSIETTSTHL